jgi:hypothetical protein
MGRRDRVDAATPAAGEREPALEVCLGLGSLREPGLSRGRDDEMSCARGSLRLEIRDRRRRSARARVGSVFGRGIGPSFGRDALALRAKDQGAPTRSGDVAGDRGDLGRFAALAP